MIREIAVWHTRTLLPGIRRSSARLSRSFHRAAIRLIAVPAAGIAMRNAESLEPPAESEFATDLLTVEELIKLRKEKRTVLKKRARETKPEKAAEGTEYRIFYCTLYFTPMESGFLAD